jgi:hypothetical protein
MTNYCNKCGVKIPNGLSVCSGCRVNSPWYLRDAEDDYYDVDGEEEDTKKNKKRKRPSNWDDD